MNNLEKEIQFAEQNVITKSLAVREAINAKRYANKYNGSLIAELRKNIENAELEFSVACDQLINLRKAALNQVRTQLLGQEIN